MRYRLCHKPTRTVRADRYATEEDSYAALNDMPFPESADYFVVIDEAAALDHFNGHRFVKVAHELIATLTASPSQPVTMQIVGDADHLQFVMTRHDCLPRGRDCNDCNITYRDPDAVVCYKCGGTLS